MQPSSVSQEPINLWNSASQLGSFLLDNSVKFNGNFNYEGYSSLLSNSLRFDGLVSSFSQKKPNTVASLSLSTKGAAFRIRRVLNQFNRFIKFNCEKIPLGFASLGSNYGESNGFREDDNGVCVSEGVPVNGVESENPKKVLILMSDTGGGHRASAEAIKAAFNEEFGDDYQVSFLKLMIDIFLLLLMINCCKLILQRDYLLDGCVYVLIVVCFKECVLQVYITDLWTDHTPWPFNQLPRSYNFLVKHGPLWKMTYYASAPRVVHQSNFAATSTFIAR